MAEFYSITLLKQNQLIHFRVLDLMSMEALIVLHLVMALLRNMHGPFQPGKNGLLVKNQSIFLEIRIKYAPR
ncbi:hypothetical protein BDE02_17G069500 [Populus trichocarpa]|nr:hypothetical protein BDE02_17G069500 [Populus trichocarpa]